MRYPLMIATFVALACSGATAPVPAAGGADAGSPAGNGTDGGGPVAGGPTNTPATPTGLIPTTADGWRALAPRAVSAPGVSVTNSADGYVLNASGRGIANVYGGWTTHIGGLQGGSWYRLSARARVLMRKSAVFSFRFTVEPEIALAFRRPETFSASDQRIFSSGL